MLDISLELIFICSSVFLIMLSFMSFKVYKPLINQIDKRASVIEEFYEDAKINENKINKINEEIEETLIKAKKHSLSLKNDAITKAKSDIDKFKQNLKLTLDNEYGKFYVSVLDTKDAFMGQLKQDTSVLQTALKNKLKQ